MAEPTHPAEAHDAWSTTEPFARSDESTLHPSEQAALEHVRRSEGDSTIFAATPSLRVGSSESQSSGAGFIRAFGALFGKRILFVHHGERGPLSFDGAASPDARNVVVLDAQGGLPLSWPTGHQLVHALKVQRPNLWDGLRSSLLRMAGDWAAYRQKPAGMGYSEAAFIADFVGGQFRDPAFWRRVRERNPSVFRTLAKAALEMLNTLLRRVGMMPRDVRGHFADLNAARDVVIDALA